VVFPSPATFGSTWPDRLKNDVFSLVSQQIKSSIMPHAEPYPPFPEGLATAPLLIIDWNKLQAEDKQEKERLFEAFATAGFCYLANIPVDPNGMFDLSPEFFALPMEEKMKYPMGTNGNYFGYKTTGQMYYDKVTSFAHILILSMVSDNRFALQEGTPDRQEFWNVSTSEHLPCSLI
jgi:hypothetical protein